MAGPGQGEFIYIERGRKVLSSTHSINLPSFSQAHGLPDQIPRRPTDLRESWQWNSSFHTPETERQTSAPGPIPHLIATPPHNNMYTSQLCLSTISLAVTLLLQTTHAATTVAAVSEYPDGQPQAPPATVSSAWPTYSASIGWPVTSSTPYENPFTIYTTMTNSLGVITGMPAVWTSQPSQPAVVTSQPPSATLPYYSGYYYNTTTSASTSTMTGSYSMSTMTTTTTTGSSSKSAVPTFAQVTGAAVSSRKVAGAGVALVVAAIGFCMV